MSGRTNQALQAPSLTCANNMLLQSIRTLLSLPLLRRGSAAKTLPSPFKVFFSTLPPAPFSVFCTASLNFGIHLPITTLRTSQLQISNSNLWITCPVGQLARPFWCKIAQPEKALRYNKKFLRLSCHLAYKFSNINIAFKIFPLVK